MNGTMFIHPNYFEYRTFTLFKYLFLPFLYAYGEIIESAFISSLEPSLLNLKYYPPILGLSENYTGVKYSAPITCLVCVSPPTPQSLLYDSVLIIHAYCMISKAIVLSFWLCSPASLAHHQLMGKYLMIIALQQPDCQTLSIIRFPPVSLPLCLNISYINIEYNLKNTDQSPKRDSTIIWQFSLYG